MNRFKYLSVFLFAALVAGVVFIACNKNDEKPGEAGKEAGAAMCNCVSSYTAPTDPTDYEAFMAYAQQLYNCLGTIAPYSQYIGLAGTMENSYGYNPDAAEPLYSVFAFKNADFEKEFKKATEVCMLPFAMLFQMMGSQ
jgi:hypothetical protein